MEHRRAERRLSAILAADVVGYSRLIEADEVGTLSAIRFLRRAIIDPNVARHQGRIVKVMGDGAITEFGSVVDAVACAVAIQKELIAQQADTAPERRIVFRMGVNLGDVVVADDDLFGDGVNVAARLEGLCPPGGVLVSGTAYDHLQGKLDLPLDFVGEQRMRNIARPVRTYAVRFEGSPPRRPLLGNRLRRSLPASVLLILIAALAAGVAWWWFQPVAPASARPSIAVLPFDNLGGDAAAGRLADGITEDIITDLARYRDFDVIARNSVETYRGEAVDIREVGRTLNVRYVLEGSIQREGERVRVTAQLIEAATASHLWSERWDRPVEDVFAVQTEVAEHVANTVGGSDLVLRESQAAANRKRPEDLQAYDLVVLAYERLLRGTEADSEAALSHVDMALIRDPDFARAYIQKAWIIQDLAKYRQNWNASYAEMEQLARTAIRYDPYDADAHILLAWTLAALGKNAEAAAETDRALELNPSSADILNIAADSMSFLGKPEDGAAMCDRSFRLNPIPPDWYYWSCVSNLYFTGRYQEAVEAADRGAVNTENNPSMLVFEAASQAELGEQSAAAETVEELKRLYPNASFEWLLNTGWNFERAADEEKILASAKKAGVRICATAEELADVAKPRRLPECAGA